MTAPVTPDVSPIMVMHSRFETAWSEYGIIEEANRALNKKNEAELSLGFRYETAMRANTAETDALRLAILYQVPATWQEALILQFHLQSAADWALMHTEAEKAAIEVAHDTLFDFMCDEIEHADEPGLLQSSEHLVSDRRRFRTGKVGA